MYRFTLLFILALLLTACSSPLEAVTPQPVAPTDSMVAATAEPLPVTSEPPASDLPTSEPPTSEPLPPIETSEPATSTPPAQEASYPLGGLVVSRGAGLELARFDALGNLETISTRPFATLSPDGAQIAYIEGDDVWLEAVDGSASPLNLTNSPERLEQGVQWWPARPGWLLVAYQPLDDMGYSAFYALMKSDGSSFTPLESEERSMSVPALSPDGVMVAYDRFGKPMLQNADTGEQISLSLDVPGHPVQMMGYPAWAVDGASVVYKLYDQQGWIGTGRYDLASGSWSLIHEYLMAGGTEPWAQSAFSPDGRWLAMVNQSDPLTMRYGAAVWVLPLAGGDPILLGAGSSPVWSADSTRLVFTQATGGAFDQDFLQLVLAESWEPVQLEGLPGGYYPQSWK
jgi:hypothetical protein